MTVTPFKRPGNPDLAAELRDLADQVERGDVRELVVVADHLSDQVFLGSAVFDDRWRLLGALEFAKDKVLKG